MDRLHIEISVQQAACPNRDVELFVFDWDVFRS